MRERDATTRREMRHMREMSSLEEVDERKLNSPDGGESGFLAQALKSH